MRDYKKHVMIVMNCIKRMDNVLLFFCICLVFCLNIEASCQDAGIVKSEQVRLSVEQEEEKSELAGLMQEIDVNYKAVKELLGYYKYKEKHWEIILESAQNIRKLTELMSQNFSRPDDWTYQELLESIQSVSKKIMTIANKNDKKESFVEVKRQIKALRQTCGKCHKHIEDNISSQIEQKEN